MTRHYYIIAVIFLLLTQACKKELEVTPYNLTTNEVTIQIDPTNYTVVTLDSLKITPVITESKPEGHAFSYSWQVWPNIGEGEMEEISNQKNLEVKILLAPKDYRYRFIVKDEVTGISYIKHGFLSVVSPFNEGWLITHNSEGKGHLGFIRTTDDAVFLSPIEDVNKKTYDEGLSAYTAVWAFNDAYQQTIFFTKKGAYRFDTQSFVQLTENSKLFFDGGNMLFEPGAYHGYDGMGGRQVIINNGNVYAANPANAFFGFNFTERFSPRLPGDYIAFPYLFKFGAIGSTTVFYDNKNYRFRNIDGTLAVTELATNSGLTNVGKRMVAADLGPSQEYFCVLKDENTGKFYLFSVSGSTSSHSSATNKNQEMLNCPDLGAATSFTTSRSAKLLYYSSGNKVYMYDINANAAKLIYEFPAGYVIKDIEMLKETFKQIEYSSPFHNKRLVVGVDNGTQGEVYYLDLNSIGEVVDNTFSKKFTGFGQITHLNVKSPY